MSLLSPKGARQFLAANYLKSVKRLLNRELAEGTLETIPELRERYDELLTRARARAFSPLTKIFSPPKNTPLSSREYADLINNIREDLSVLILSLDDIDTQLDDDIEQLDKRLGDKKALLGKLESQTYLARELSRSKIGGNLGVATSFREAAIPRTYRNQTSYPKALFRDYKSKKLFAHEQDAVVSPSGHYLGLGQRVIKQYKPDKFEPLYDVNAPRGSILKSLTPPSRSNDPSFRQVYDAKFFRLGEATSATFKFIVYVGGGNKTVNTLFIRSLARDISVLKNLFYLSPRSADQQQWIQIPLSDGGDDKVFLGSDSKILFDEVLTDAFLLEIETSDAATSLDESNASQAIESYYDSRRTLQFASSDLAKVSQPRLVDSLLPASSRTTAASSLIELTFYSEISFALMQPVNHSVYLSPEIGQQRTTALKRLKRAAIKAQISRPTLNTTTGRISYKVDTYSNSTFTASERPLGSVEFWVIHIHQDNRGLYLTEVYPILPLGLASPQVTHERLLPFNVDEGTRIAKAELQFYPSAVPVIYKNYTISSNWTASSDNTNLGRAKYIIEIDDYDDTAVYTTVYNPLLSNIRVDPDADPNIDLLTDTNIKFVSYAEGNNVILDNDSTLAVINDNDYPDIIYLQILLRRNSTITNLSPRVESFSFFVDGDLG